MAPLPAPLLVSPQEVLIKSVSVCCILINPTVNPFHTDTHVRVFRVVHLQASSNGFRRPALAQPHHHIIDKATVGLPTGMPRLPSPFQCPLVGGLIPITPNGTAVLRHIHASVPAAFFLVFESITVFGASRFLLPLILIAALWLLYEQRRAEAFLLAASVITSAVFVHVVKAIVQRDRPTLWQTEWYWGSSFPSGHALVFSAFAISAALCVARIWPMKRTLALSVAILCLVMVAFSRLVLGVHWPTDVLAAVCTGVFIPLAMDITLHLYFYLRRS